MAFGVQLVPIQRSSVPFLTSAGHISNADVKTYLHSVSSHLQDKGGPQYDALKQSLDTIRANGLIQAALAAADNTGTAGNSPAVGARPHLLSLDKIAYQIKSLAGHQVYVQPVTAAVPRVLSTTNAGVRQAFDDLIDRFNESFQGDGAAATQTIVNAPPPNTTYRIDRESLSAGPGPRYWTYRIQAGGSTYGGIEMQSEVYFRIVDVRAALTASLNSTLTGHGPARYVRLSAPQWLNAILNAA